MRKRSFKRGVALGLAMMLAMPVQPAFADIPDDAITAEDQQEEQTEESAESPDQEETEDKASEEESGTEGSEEKDEDLDSEDAKEKDAEDSEGGDEADDSSEDRSEVSEDGEKQPEEKSGQDTDKKADTDSDKKPDKDSAKDTDLTSDKAEKAEDEEELEDDLLEDVDLATASNADLLYDEVIYNTGDYEVHVVDEDIFKEESLGDAYFENDGSYTIAIPEENPFFPYEVQFTHDGKKEEAWFMDPDDSVEVDGHKFYVSAYFDDTAITQMSLEIGGEIVPVYPKEKKFTNDGNGVMPMSLLPLEERYLNVDLTGYSPLELSMVKVDSVFTGTNELQDTDKIIWKTDDYPDSYTVNKQDGYLDLAHQTSSSWAYYELIVGKVDQLEASNVRYTISVDVTNSTEWISAEVFKIEKTDAEKKQIPVEVIESSYTDDGCNEDDRILQIDLDDDPDDDQYSFGYTLTFDENNFENSNVERIRIFKEDGTFFTAERLKDGVAKVTIPDKEEMSDFVVEAQGSGGKVIGKLPLSVELEGESKEVYRSSLHGSLYALSDNELVSYRSNSRSDAISSLNNGTLRKVTGTLEAGYPVNSKYRLVLNYTNTYPDAKSDVLAAYLGSYKTIAEAKAAGKENLKDTLFQRDAGYAADYSKAVTFTVFVGTDEKHIEKVWWYQYQVEAGTYVPSSSTDVHFTALLDTEGNRVPCNIIAWNEDSYADYTYLTIVVDEDAPVDALAPEFYMYDSKLNLYAEGANSPEISGQSVHDFSNGPVQYTASAENKENARNYWLQVIQPGKDYLYVNSLASDDAKTEEESGVITSTREVMLDSRHSNVHDILLINMGSEPIVDLGVELDSDTVALDEYWTLTGENDLRGFSGLEDENTWNMAKIRLVSTKDKYAGEITGKLKVKSGDETLMIFNLTGVAGDPTITTTQIPDAVKYVHYGTMIQNSNKYDFNKVTYSLAGGKLPNGMQMMANGELYGVPTESGTFTFKVRMKNSVSGFRDVQRSFTFTVAENSDANVDGATDPEYWLKERVPDINYRDTNDYTMTSVGVFSEWVNLYLDGKKLTEGVDFEAESGSTRLTIRSQTLKADGVNGAHTLSAEFRETGTKTLKRAAQNYHLSGGASKPNNNGTTNRSDNDKDSSDSKSGLYQDSKKGYMSAQSGIVTGSGTGYSSWVQTENGWKLTYADGTTAAGYTVQQEDGSTVDQILWEKINGSWYAFNPNGTLATGWVYDYQLANWYFVSEQSGMISGWCEVSPDGYTYYLDPATGALAYGWKKVGDKWYYLNDRPGEKTWIYQEETDTWVYQMTKAKPWGAMYKNETTPDGYQVDETGAWDGNAAK